MLTTNGDRPIDNWVMGSVRDWQKKTQEEKGKKETERLRRSNVAMAHPSRDGWAKGKNFNNAPFQIKKWKKKKPHKNPARSATHGNSRRYHKPCLYYFIIIFLLLFSSASTKKVSASFLVFFCLSSLHPFSNLSISEIKDTCYSDFVTSSTNQSNSLPFLERKSN